MKTFKTILTIVLFIIVSNTIFGQAIVGSKHDFSAAAWNTFNYGVGLGEDQICKVCHTPHNASLVADEKPLWNHSVTASVFTLYSNTTFQGATTITQPDGVSKLCLSCHDGTVAIDNFGGVGTSTTFMVGAPLLGTDLSNDHPVSFDFTTALATSDGTLFDPSTKEWNGVGSGTIQSKLLFGDKLQCASCHNPHDKTNGKFLRKSNTNSGLCLTCHNK